MEIICNNNKKETYTETYTQQTNNVSQNTPAEQMTQQVALRTVPQDIIGDSRTPLENPDGNFLVSILSKLDEKSLSRLDDHSMKVLHIKNGEQEGIDLEEVEPYTYQTFKVLKEENKEKGLPYFIATWKNGNTNPRYVDAASFVRSYFRFNNTSDPITRAEIPFFNIYKMSTKNDFFKFFCDETTLQQKIGKAQSHYSKYIGACNTEKTESRGEKRYYMSVHNILRAEENENNPDRATKYYEKANFWLNLALEDGHHKALIEQVCWLWEGNTVLAQDKDKALALLKGHIHTLIMDKDDDYRLVNMYIELLNEHNPNNIQEVMFCNSLLESENINPL